MRRSRLYLICSLIVSVAVSQPERLVLRTYTSVDGLPSNTVTDIVQDSAGVIWVATDRGVVGSLRDRFYVERTFRYDYLATGRLRMGRATGDNGYLLAGKGVAREVSYVRTQYQWEGYELRSVFPEWDPDSTHDLEFTAAVESPDGRVVFGTELHGLWMREAPDRRDHGNDTWLYRGTRLTRVPLEASVTALSLADGAVWIGTDRGLYRLVEDSCVRVAWPALRRASITALTADSEGRLWVATSAGVYMMTGSGSKRLEAAGTVSATDVAVARNGDVWVGTAGRGLWRLRGDERTIVGVIDGLASERIEALTIDRDDNLWVGTDRGVTKILPWSYRSYESGRMLPAGAWNAGLESRDGAMWFAGPGALAKFERNSLRTWTAPADMRRMAFRQLVEDGSGVLWALVDDGVVSFDGRNFRFVADDSAGVERSHGSMLMHDARWGIVIVRPNQVRALRGSGFVTLAMNPTPRQFSGASFDGHGVLWLGSWSSVVSVTSDGAVTTYPFLGSCVRVMSAGAGAVALIDQQVGVVLSTEAESARIGGVPASWLSRSEDPSGGWFSDGFVLKDGRRMLVVGGSKILEQPTPNIILTSEPRSFVRYLVYVLQRRSGSLLMLNNVSEGNQLVEVDPTNNTIRPQRHLQEILTPNLSGDDFALIGTGLGMHSQRILEDRTGTLWCATRTGIVALPPFGGPASQHAPPIMSITAGSIRLLPGLTSRLGAVSTVPSWYKSQVRGALSGFADSVRFTLRAEDNDLSFDATSADHQMELGTLFQARLDGLDTAWSAPQASGRFDYRDVPQGSYRFRVRCLTADGVASPERVADLSLILPFWKMAWFGIAVVVTVVYVSGRVTSKRMRRLREEHVRLTRQAVQENELRMARAVQMGMLPERAPELPGFEIAARSLPATEVGGDFYDFIQDGTRTGIAVGDVSGHGITGAMIVGMARTSLRFASSRFERPARVLTLANERLRQDISRNVFIAMFYGLLDPKRRTLQYICAGQPTPILIRRGSAEFLPRSKGDRFPLGIVPRVSYREERVALRTGDTLVLYTDGFVEAMNPAREEFGFERFQRALVRHAGLPTKEFIDAMCADVASHAAGAAQEDDMTMVVIRVRKEGRP